MPVRVVVGEGEPISQALRRFKKLLYELGVSWEMWRRGAARDHSQERRFKRHRKRFLARQATLWAQQAALQPVASLEEAQRRFRKKRGKP